MAKDIKKIRAESSTDEDLIEECKKEINCGECELVWNNNLPKGQQITPPSNTLAIVVDVIHNQGAVRIFEKDTGEYVNGVGTEEAGYRIILPWQASWRLRASGTIDVGYIKESQGG